MCSTFTPDCGFENSTIILIGDVYCPNTNVWVNFACTKKLFNLLAEAIINVRNVVLCAGCEIVLLKIKQIPFFCRLVKVFTFLKRAENQFKMFLEMFIVLASIVLAKRNARQLQAQSMLVESVELGCSFTKFFLCYKST